MLRLLSTIIFYRFLCILANSFSFVGQENETTARLLWPGQFLKRHQCSFLLGGPGDLPQLCFLPPSQLSKMLFNRKKVHRKSTKAKIPLRAIPKINWTASGEGGWVAYCNESIVWWRGLDKKRNLPNEYALGREIPWRETYFSVMNFPTNNNNWCRPQFMGEAVAFLLIKWAPVHDLYKLYMHGGDQKLLGRKT